MGRQGRARPDAGAERAARSASCASRRGRGSRERPWPQSRGSQLAGERGRRPPGERVLDLCAAPGGKTDQLAAARARSWPSRCIRAGRASSRRTCAARRRQLARRERRRTRAPGRARRLRPRSRGRPLLGPRRPQLASGSPLARPPAPGAPARAPAGRGRARRARRVDHVLRLHVTRAENEDVVDALRLPVDDLGAEFPSSGIRGAPSSCSRCRTSTGRRGSSSPACASVGFPRCPGNAGCARSRWSPRSTRPTSFGLGEQIDHLIGAGARVFHFDVGDGHFVEPVTIGPIVLQSISPLDPQVGGRHRLPPHGRQPGAPLRDDREGGRRQRHVPLSRRATRSLDGRPRARPRARRRGRVQSGDSGRTRCRGGPRLRPRPLHEHRPGYSGQDFMPESIRPDPRARELLPTAFTSRWTAESAPARSPTSRAAGANLLVAGSAVFAGEDAGAAYRRLAEAVAAGTARARARARRAGRGDDAAEPGGRRRRRHRRRGRRRGLARAARRPTRRASCARGRGRAGARGHALHDPRAVHA